MTQTLLNWKVAGAAGEGIKTTGMMFSKTCIRHGLFTFDYTEYPSLIRGGHNTYQVAAGQTKVYSQEKAVDVLVALNRNALVFHTKEVKQQGMILYDPDTITDAAALITQGTGCPVPFVKLAKEAGGEAVMANNVALGASLYLFGLDTSILDKVIADIFALKEAVVTLNQKAAKAGYEYAKDHFKPYSQFSFTKSAAKAPYSMTGNEAISLGCIAGGMKAYFAYPMTPSSSVLHVLAEWADKAKLMVKHAEDEIGVVNMALGASFAGARVAVGTSGGGFAYMTEALGFAGVAELPIVFIESMRPGPALGMPTWTAQADLQFVLSASQDEFPRLVLAPGDVYEAFEMTRLSFDLAEKYQLPVILLSDKHLSEGAESIDLPQTSFPVNRFGFDQKPQPDDTGFYPRYQVTDTGISYRSLPGQAGGFYMANSYEHDVHGIGSEESGDRVEQMDKRFRKMTLLAKEIPAQFYDGSDHPEITFITFGSTKMAVRAALTTLREQGIDAALYHITWMHPFPVPATIEAIQQSQNPVVVEGNKTNQLARLIRQETGIDVYHKRVKYDGRPFYPDEIIQYAKEILGK